MEEEARLAALTKDNTGKAGGSENGRSLPKRSNVHQRAGEAEMLYGLTHDASTWKRKSQVDYFPDPVLLSTGRSPSNCAHTSRRPYVIPNPLALGSHEN